MNFSAAAQGIVEGLKPFASGEARETLEAIEHGLHTVDHGIRVVNGVLDTIERGVGIGRDLLATFHQSGQTGAANSAADPAAASGAAAQPQPPSEQTAAERAADLLKRTNDEMQYSRMMAHHQAMTRRLQGLMGLSSDRMDTFDRLRRGSSSSSGYLRR